MRRNMIQIYGFRIRTQARCECGWSSRKRWLRINSVLDAWDHSDTTGHRLNPIDAYGEIVQHLTPRRGLR